MLDFRPIFSVIGLMVASLGLSMTIPMLVGWIMQDDQWLAFAYSSFICASVGAVLALSAANGVAQGLSKQQTFLLTTGVWVALPVFGAIPFMLGGVEMSLTDALFEAVSGLTTTGSTVMTELDNAPRSLLLWRSMLQWFGGIGIIVVAMVFLPELRIGGMQVFRTEGFDTMGKILPRAAEIAAQIAWIYLSLTFVCFLAYRATGMSVFDATNHALTTLATGGFSTSDASFGAFGVGAQYVGAIFMLLAALPFVRYIQLLAGDSNALLTDQQIQGFAIVTITGFSALVALQLLTGAGSFEATMRSSLFNAVSIVTGTGYASTDYQLWGPLAIVIFFFLGLIGGCAGSTCCSVKVFRYQILISSVRTQIRQLYAPHGVFSPRFEGRPVSDDVLNSVMAFFVLFFVSIGVLSMALALTGLDTVTAVSGAATALANVGPGLGDTIGPSGTFATLNDPAKLLLIIGMLLGRLELLVVFVLFSAQFWRQ